jgi:hypothetical protein
MRISRKIILFMIMVVPLGLEAQMNWEPQQRKNVIKFNPTPMLIWGSARNITLSYERLVTPKQSFSVKLGYLVFPRISGDTVANLITLTGREKYGVNIGVDYRFYPISRNRRPAPDGLFIGPYFDFYGYRFGNNFDILNTTVDQNGRFEGKLNYYTLGFQLGYQFLFWKRFSLEMVLFGPGVSYINAKLAVKGTLDQEQIQNIDKEVVDELLSRYPFLKTVFSPGGMQFTGSKATLGIGFRYLIQVGVAF